FRWREVWCSFDDCYRPFGMVDQSVVAPAEQHQIVEVSGAAVEPMLNMVCVCPAGRHMTLRESTPLVPYDECVPLRRFDESPGASHIYRYRFAIQYHRHQVGVTSDSSRC